MFTFSITQYVPKKVMNKNTHIQSHRFGANTVVMDNTV